MRYLGGRYAFARLARRFSGGAGNLFVGIEAKAFRYTQGAPRRFSRDRAATTPIREFCGYCGVHVAGRITAIPDGVVIKIGTLDDPSVFEGPNMVFWTREKQAFHILPEGVEVFETLPNR